MLPDKTDCCGCGVCENVCPKSACKLIKDDCGFYYPFIDEAQCVNCGLCENRCPIYNSKKLGFVSKECVSFAGHYKDEKRTMESASGGAATALSEVVIKSGGIVYGVAYSSNFTYSLHIRCENLTDLKKLKGSKYNQSRKGLIYKNVLADLLAGRLVFYIGTPCEIAGLKCYLNKDYQNLITCELICEGTTSEDILKDFISYLEKKYSSRVVDFSARFKKHDWAPAYVRAVMENRKEYCKLAHFTDYGEGHKWLVRPSCYSCKFKGSNKVADITVGDCWGLPKGSPLWYRYGVSVIMLHTDRADGLIKQMQDFELHPIEYKDGYNPRLTTSLQRMNGSEKFVALFPTKGLKKAAKETRTFNGSVKRIVYNILPDDLIYKLKNKV